VWYENTGGGIFVPHTIDNFLDLAFKLWVVDLDQDGDLDVLATGGSANALVWYENDLVGIVETAFEVAPLSGVSELSIRPNPFSTHTTFRIAVDRAMSFDLRIYDVGGRLVQTSLHYAPTAGPTQIFWDRRDSQGARVPAGIYFYTLATPGSMRTGQMCVVD
jgi:hypothetical protein